MTPLDYGRSFVIGNTPANEVRFWVESRTRWIDERAGTHADYIQCGSCKSEDTFADKNLFWENNYNFLPVFGPEYGVIFRRHAHLNVNYKTCNEAGKMWEGQSYHLVEERNVEELETDEAIIAATKEFPPIVAQTEIWDADTQLRAIIEYPVKTLNTRLDPLKYQVDTGPVAFPDLGKNYDYNVERLSLAFVAFNAPHFADFILECPTPVLDDGSEGEEITRVHHYSRPISLEAKNRVYAVRG